MALCGNKKTFEIQDKEETVICDRNSNHPGMHAGWCDLVRGQVFW